MHVANLSLNPNPEQGRRHPESPEEEEGVSGCRRPCFLCIPLPHPVNAQQATTARNRATATTARNLAQPALSFFVRCSICYIAYSI